MKIMMNQSVITDISLQNHLKRRRSSYGVSRFRAKNLAKQQDFIPINGLSPIPNSSTLNQLSQPTPLSVPNIESSRSEPEDYEKRDNCTPQHHKRCQCKQTKCLKLYCECFSSGFDCNGCKCVDCHNNIENELARNTAVKSILKRKPNAFGRVQNQDSALVEKDKRGCQCKKTFCLKRYCECFQADILCSENCKCLDCKNFDGCSEKLVRKTIGFDDRKKTVQPVTAVTTFDSPPVLSLSPPLKYRSLLADIIGPHSIRNFCSRLVVESDPSKMLAVNPFPLEKKAVKKEDKEIWELVHDDNLKEKSSNGQKGIPLSPEAGTLLSPMRKLKHDHNTNIYAEQERLVLTYFRDYLQKLIICGIDKVEAVAKGQLERGGSGILGDKVERPDLKCTAFR